MKNGKSVGLAAHSLGAKKKIKGFSSHRFGTAVDGRWAVRLMVVSCFVGFRCGKGIIYLVESINLALVGVSPLEKLDC